MSRTHTSWQMRSLVLVAMLGGLLLIPGKATAQVEPIQVRAILFYSPSCGHCHQVITEDLPPLFEKYGEALNIIGINISIEQGYQLFDATLKMFNIPADQGGVPFLVVGDTYLFGSVDIPEKFPGIVEAGMANGGIDWPAIPGLPELIAEAEAEAAAGATAAAATQESAALAPAATEEIASSAPLSPEGEFPSTTLSISERFNQDLAGNTLAVIVLIALVITAALVFYWMFASANTGKVPNLPSAPAWATPVLCLVGFGVAAYLAFVETTQTEAICGPVGNCNAVQQSPYAYLFGVLPIGVLGLIGYTLILAAWLWFKFGPLQHQRLAILAIWTMCLSGVLFSTYLTFLEPFVIGATCAWCLTSAVVMLGLLLVNTPAGLRALLTSSPEPAGA